MSPIYLLLGFAALRVALSLMLLAVIVYILVQVIGVVFSVLWVAAPYLIVTYILYVLIWNRTR